MNIKINNPLYTFRTSIFRYSPRKLQVVSRALRLRSIDEAIGFMTMLNKKCALPIVKSLNTMKNNLLQNPHLVGFNHDSLVIVGVVVEKKVRAHGIRYHACSRFARTNFNFCRLKFEFKEKNMP